MPRKKHIIEKKIFKLAAGKCRICGESNYALLDVHRLIPGSEKGRYTRENSTVICCRCHRLVHDGKIVLDRYYMTTAGEKLRIIRDGKEDFI